MPKILPAIQPNAGIRTAYKKRLVKELRAMQKSIAYWVRAAYRRRESEITADASPVWDILGSFNTHCTRWMKRWNTLATWLSRDMVRKMDKAMLSSLDQSFKAAGFGIKYPTSRNLNATTQALIKGNVDLIKSIGAKYLDDVRGIITRGVAQGNDLNFITKELHKRYGVTERRAAFIARDQTDKAAQCIMRTRDLDHGITEGIWVHLPGRYTSRPTHKHMAGQRFKLDEGCYDATKGVERKVKPGELPGCRCTYRRVLPELGDTI